MSDSSYYPSGAYNDPNAPYNQCSPDAQDVEVLISTTLSKHTIISVDDYTAESWEDWDDDDEGGYTHTGGIDYDFSNCDFKKAYEEGNEYTLPQLLDHIITICDKHLQYIQDYKERCKKANIKPIKSAISKWKYWMTLRNSASNWTEDELEIMKD